MTAYRVSIVNYLNSAPFVQGIKSASGLEMELHLDHPSESARKLLDGEVDIALAPIAIIPRLPNSSIISDFCIGTLGEVKTVKIFSDTKVKDIKRIYLDYQSETSVQLTRILCKNYWKISPELVPAYPGFQKDIYGSSAGLIIGDRAIRVLGKYPYEYDLGLEWNRWTGLPFVFAVWLSNKEIEPEWKKDFNKALSIGLDNRSEVISTYEHLDNPLFNVQEYLTSNIDYNFDEQKKLALEKYLSNIER